MVVIVFFRCSFFEHFQFGISIRVLSGLCSLSIFFLLFFSIRHRVLTPPTQGEVDGKQEITRTLEGPISAASTPSFPPEYPVLIRNSMELITGTRQQEPDALYRKQYRDSETKGTVVR